MAGESSQQQQQQQQKKPPLSCTSCRARKLKCDKQDPCRNCARSGSECVFPARKRIQRPRKTKNAELLQRLNRLESIVGRVGLANLEGLEASAGSGGGETAAAGNAGADADADANANVDVHPTTAESCRLRPPTEAGDLGPHVACPRSPFGPKGALLPQDSTASRYMSGEFWSSLCDEVGGLRQALEQSTDSDEEEDDEGTSPESTGGSGGGMNILTAPGMLLGTQQRSSPYALEHPSPEHIQYLASVYFRNVDMHLKILHRPTILNALSDLAAQPETASDLSPESTALFFAIYYAAITSLTSAECMRNLGRPRGDLATLFQAGIEQALLRADYLNNTSIETLQALTLYTCCLRSHNGSRSSWALLGLPIRLAQALNIHQDGDGSHARLTPFEAEQRRRLWWQLIVLDIRAAEDRGTSTVIARGSYDTRLPHNIDDVEFGPETAEPLRDRPGPSDATFGLFTAQSSGIFLWSEHARQNISVDETVRRAKLLEDQFVKNADPEHVGSYLASVTVRLIILKMWLLMRYPLRPRGMANLASMRQGAAQGPVAIPGPSTIATAMGHLPAVPIVSRQSTLRTAVSIMEISEFLETGPYSDRFRWFCETYVQWHPLAVALAELCTQTEGDAVQHAWQVVEVVFPRWSDRIADAKRGSLWRPIRKLYKKAKAAKEAALSAGESSRNSQSQSESPHTQSHTQTHTLWGTPAQASTSASQLSGLEPAVDYMAIDPALSAESTQLRPRLITDMILSEATANTISGSGAPMSYAKLASEMPSNPPAPNTYRTQSREDPTFARPQKTKRATETPEMPPPPFDLDTIIGGDSGQSMAQALLAWPDMSFDMPPAFSTGDSYDTTQLQAPESAMTDSAPEQEPVPIGPVMMDPTMMNWSTWDEFVLETYEDTTPDSGKSEGS